MATGDRPAATESGGTQSFGCNVKELKELMQQRGAEAHGVIQTNYGGVNGLCSRLKTHPTKGKSSLLSSLSIYHHQWQGGRGGARGNAASLNLSFSGNLFLK